MKRSSIMLAHVVVLAVLLAFGFLPCEAGRYVEDSVKVDGYQRQLVMYLPDGLQPDAPLVFILHGYGAGIWRENPMLAAADRHGFAVCLPQGLKDPQGEPSWNVGYPFQQVWKVNDVKALCSMAHYVQKRYRLSRQNTFLTGMSNGGEMCYLMAYSKQSTFKAVVPIAGLTMAWIYEQMEAPHPIPIMEIHGTEDRVSQWMGDMEDKGGWGAYLPVPLAIGYWIAKNRCSHEEVENLQVNEGHLIIKHRYSSPTTGCDVWLYEVVGGVHSWFTNDIDTGEEVWQFFSRYVK